MSTQKIIVKLHGHEWAVYPLKCRDSTIYRVVHWVNGERRPKTFPTLKKAKADALALLREVYAKGESKIHLTADEKLDWKSANAVLKQAGVRSSLETICRHYVDLANIVGGTDLLTDVARKHAAARGKGVTPINLSALRDAYEAALKKRERSDRYIDAQRSNTGQFVVYVGADRMSNEVTRELLQHFIDSKRKVDARTKANLLDAIRAMMTYAKSIRAVEREWDEANHVDVPAVPSKKVPTFTAEELTKLMSATPPRFRPVLALAAFAGIRSSELELLDWKHIRLLEEQERDRIIVLDIDVTEESSKRSIPITDTLYRWLAPAFKPKGKLWTGKHDDFYRAQQEVATKASIEWKHNALRHTCISARVALTRNVPQVAYEAGNSVAVIKKHYLDLMTPSVAEAWFAVTPAAVRDFEGAISAEHTPAAK